MKALIDLFRVPSAKTLAQRQIEESEALGVVDSMKGELDYMRRDGLL